MATAAQGMAGGASNFIGSLISLISKSDIRYQGFLAQIDAEQATIALEKVRSWGTEGRLVQQGRPSSEELPPNDNVYESIVFRAADVKDLKIDDPNPQRNAPAPPPQLPHDPAIMNVSTFLRI
jgi:protein LSM14